MIIRPLEPQSPASAEFLPAWPVVERIQRHQYQSCWLITQPSHAALAGTLASALNDPHFPKPDANLIQAIALHDAGWGMPDAQIIQESRSNSAYQPGSFLEMSVPEFLSAWTRSIEVAQSVSPGGGYIVSRHFYRLAEHRVNASEDAKPDRQKLESFLSGEARREKKLASLQTLDIPKLELLTDLLQFCDLLSLYICCGALENVAFPEYFGIQLRITHEAGGIRLNPPVIAPNAKFSFAALLHPQRKDLAGKEMSVQIL
jgi:hypothetical protein